MENIQLLTIAQTAEKLALAESMVRKLIASGRLKAFKLGRSVRLKMSDVIAFVEANAIA